jgi:ADP-ribose pyrophosphatase YjhB (NUDIX family)
MSIRSTAKAIIIKDGKILLNKCCDKTNGEYYSLPGGGQHQHETLHETITRECLEETGYSVVPIRYAALCEEIIMDLNFREENPDYSHRMYHIFICELINEEVKNPIERDYMQISCEWIKLDIINSIKLLPTLLKENIYEIINNKETNYFGAEYISYNQDQ